MGKAMRQNRFMRIVTVPMKALSKARDLYISCITECAQPRIYGRVNSGRQASGFLRSLSTSSYASSNDSDDLRELIRANSTTDMGITRAEFELYVRQHVKELATARTSRGVPRSSSVGMASIDEEGPYLAGGNINFNLFSGEQVMPRSRSHAVNNRGFRF